MKLVKIARYTQSEVDRMRRGMMKGGQGRDAMLGEEWQERNKERYAKVPEGRGKVSGGKTRS